MATYPNNQNTNRRANRRRQSARYENPNISPETQQPISILRRPNQTTGSSAAGSPRQTDRYEAPHDPAILLRNMIARDETIRDSPLSPPYTRTSPIDPIPFIDLSPESTIDYYDDDDEAFYAAIERSLQEIVRQTEIIPPNIIS